MPQTQLNTKTGNFRLPEGIATFAPGWPGPRKGGKAPPAVFPGDLSKFVVHRHDAYSNHEFTEKSPFLGAPRIEEQGGVVYFKNDTSNARFDALMSVMGVDSDELEYAVFVEDSKNPRQDGCLLQVRIVSAFGMRHLFDAMDGFEHHVAFGKQKVSVREAIWAFIEEERERWGTDMAYDGQPLSSASGANGDDEKAMLSFGFMVESEYYGIYRFWSRAWIVSK